MPSRKPPGSADAGPPWLDIVSQARGLSSRLIEVRGYRSGRTSVVGLFVAVMLQPPRVAGRGRVLGVALAVSVVCFLVAKASLSPPASLKSETTPPQKLSTTTPRGVMSTPEEKLTATSTPREKMMGPEDAMKALGSYDAIIGRVFYNLIDDLQCTEDYDPPCRAADAFFDFGHSFGAGNDPDPWGKEHPYRCSTCAVEQCVQWAPIMGYNPALCDPLGAEMTAPAPDVVSILTTPRLTVHPRLPFTKLPILRRQTSPSPRRRGPSRSRSTASGRPSAPTVSTTSRGSGTTPEATRAGPRGRARARPSTAQSRRGWCSSARRSRRPCQ